MTVTVVREEERAPLRLVATEDEPQDRKIVDEDAVRIQAIGTLHGLASLLAARSILLLSVIGAFALGLLATLSGAPGAIVAATLYDLFIVVPMVMLAWRKG